jgi:hypothetical protein
MDHAAVQAGIDRFGIGDIGLVQQGGAAPRDAGMKRA